MDADVGEDQDKQGEEDGNVDEDTLEISRMRSPFRLCQVRDKVVVDQVWEKA